MARLSRKEMKTDEVREVLDRVFLFAGEHWRQLAAGVGAVAVLLAIVLGVLAYRGAQETAAQEQLVAALKTVTATIDPIAPSLDDATEPSFRTESDRAAAAREELQALIDERGSSAAAEVARGYMAEMHAEAGEMEAARALWRELLERNRANSLGSNARLNLIQLDREDGRAEEVANSLQQELADGSGSLPEDLLLFQLGVALEDLGRAEEAATNFRRLVDDHPRSPYLAQAQRRLASAG